MRHYLLHVCRTCLVSVVIHVRLPYSSVVRTMSVTARSSLYDDAVLRTNFLYTEPGTCTPTTQALE